MVVKVDLSSNYGMSEDEMDKGRPVQWDEKMQMKEEIDEEGRKMRNWCESRCRILFFSLNGQRHFKKRTIHYSKEMITNFQTHHKSIQIPKIL